MPYLPNIHVMTDRQRRREIAIAESYLHDAERTANEHWPKTDLIGRALTDQVLRMERILRRVKKGYPFGHKKNR